MIRRSRNTTRITSQVGRVAGEAERDEEADDQRLVGDRIEQRAEIGALVEMLGDIAVDRIGDAGRRKNPKRQCRNRRSKSATRRAALRASARG